MMIRRCLLTVAGLALAPALSAGCGPILRTAVKVDAVLQKAELAWMPNRLNYTVYQPSQRVALATMDLLKEELAEVKVLDIEVSRDDRYNTPEGKMPKPGEVRIPDEYPAFWMDGLDSDGPVLVNCRSVDFEGKTKAGEAVEVSVRLEIMGPDQRTVVSVQVGRRGDPKATKELIDKISERVHAPKLQPGSPEEQASLNIVFGHRPGKDELKVLASGDLLISKK
jgi:hypothetical protein